MEERPRSVGRYVSILYRQAQCYITHELAPYKIGRGQYIFLHVLYGKDGISQEELAHILKIDKGTTARAVEKLEKNGYIRREKNAEDKRAYDVYLTDKAKTFKPIFYKKLRSWTERVLKDFSSEEKDFIFSFLEKMVENAVCEVHNED